MRQTRKSSFLTQIDCYNIPISLSYKGEQEYKTWVGGIFTVLFILGTIAITVYYIYELISKDTFTIVTNSYMEPDIEINITDIPIFFTLTNSKGHIEYDERLYSFVALYEIFDEERGYETQFLELERCDKVILPNDSNYNYFEQFNLTRFICIKPGQELFIKGVHGFPSSRANDFRIYVSRCDKSKRNDCYNDSIVNDTLYNMNFLFYMLGYKVDHYDKNGKNVDPQIWGQARSFSTEYSKKHYFLLSKSIYNLKGTYFWSKSKRFEFCELSQFFLGY